MWPSNSTSSTPSSSVGTPYRPFEAAFEDFRANPFPSPEPPVPPPAVLSLSPPLPQPAVSLPSTSTSSAETRSNNNTWDALSPPSDATDKTSVSVTVETPNVVVVTVADLVESVSEQTIKRDLDDTY